MSPNPSPMHQYIDRKTGAVRQEQFLGDAMVRALYAGVRENAGWLFSALTSPRMSRILAAVNYDLPFSGFSFARKFTDTLGVCLAECLDPQRLTTPRAVFERKIRYWECRPGPENPRAVLAPADSRMIPASLAESPLVEIKGKFFELAELVGHREWMHRFAAGDIAIFRLTPEQYHYNHTPVSGRICDTFTIEGRCHACHPDAVVREATPYSKNRRLVTLIDTDVPGGTRVGLVAMVEVVALMIGGIREAYSDKAYDAPRSLARGDRVDAGKPKSLFYPGSSTVVLLFEPQKIRFDADLLENVRRMDATSRFSTGFTRPLVETQVRVRQQIATPAGSANSFIAGTLS